jgi:hypothetical protein
MTRLGGTAMGRAARVALVVSILAGSLAGVVHAQPDTEDPIEARTFRVYYKALADASDVVSPLLSDDGSLTMRKRLNTLVVQDHVSVLERVASLLESFDLPPRNVEVTLTLFLGMVRQDDEEREVSSSNVMTREIRGIVETLKDFTKFHDYEPLGSRSINGLEGASVTADLTKDYRVVFTVDVVDERRGLVKFERVVLQRLERDEQGRETAEELYSMGMVMEMDRLRVVGAASGPDSKRALFLTVQVSER